MRLFPPLAALLVIGAPLLAESDQKSTELLAAATQALRSAESQQVTLSVVSKGEVENRISFDMAFSAPNKFRRVTTLEDKVAEIRSSDGSGLTTYLGDIAKYETLPAPATMEQLVGTDPLGRMCLVPAMLGAEGDKVLMALGDSFAYAGETTTDGVASHRIDFQQQEGAAYFLLSTATPPRLQQIVMGDKTPVTTTYRFTWGEAAPSAESFAFVAPKGAEKVKSLDEEINKLREAPVYPAHELAGKPAPAVKLKDLGGADVDIATHLGKDIVILDFWATWCGPCRRGMPILDTIRKDYAGKGLAVYSVNLGDDTEAIQKFLTETKVEMPTLLDTEGVVGTAYKVDPIPQLVIIDKAGTVAKVEIGVSPTYDADLRAVIDGLLAPPSAP